MADMSSMSPEMRQLYLSNNLVVSVLVIINKKVAYSILNLECTYFSHLQYIIRPAKVYFTEGLIHRLQVAIFRLQIISLMLKKISEIKI